MGKGKGKGNEKGKGKGRWKEDNLRKVGRTHAQAHRWFYTLPSAMHSTGQRINCFNNDVTLRDVTKRKIIHIRRTW